MANVKEVNIEAIRNNERDSVGFDDIKLNYDDCVSLAYALRINTSLQTLSLFRCDLGPKEAKLIAESLHYHPRIDYLTFYVNNLGDEGATAVANLLRVNKSIRVINIDQNEVTDVGIAALCQALRYNDYVHSLHIYTNKYGDQGAFALADLIECNYTIRYIDLPYNRIGASGAEKLIKALEKNAIIETFNFQGNPGHTEDIQNIISNILLRNSSSTEEEKRIWIKNRKKIRVRFMSNKIGLIFALIHKKNRNRYNECPMAQLPREILHMILDVWRENDGPLFSSKAFFDCEANNLHFMA